MPTSLVRGLLQSDVRYLLVERDGSIQVEPQFEAPALLPGSFNPLHHGHELLTDAAADQLGREVMLELSVTNVDKPPLEAGEVLRRIEQFRGRWRVLLTRAPTFVEKARLFPGTMFVVGWDTAVRLFLPRYYGGETEMQAALEEMRALGSRFLVGGRSIDGEFRTLDDIVVPEPFAGMMEQIPESRFRADISSTQLRGDS
jgi:hypothetical protein